ncbi:MAG: phosphate signaling complex protein PhoU [Nitrospinae bacterium]|nr:phosphate signaling complex protein PhoU [Nitrospinota bacterium]
MPKHLRRDLENLKKEMLYMGSMVEGAINKAINSLVARNTEWAEDVMKGDDEIDAKENEIQEECLKVLALHQPVAEDLRFIITVMKVNNDLERMGDLAVNIAERGVYLSTQPPIRAPLNFSKMMERVQAMVHESLNALVNSDTALARKVWREDDAVDEMNKEMYVALQDLMREDPDTIQRAIHTLSASRHLERIADLATNIAEDIIFMAEGEIVRHRLEDYLKQENQA